MSIIKRNDTLNYVLQYWNHNESSCIGAGRLQRKLNSDGIYVHTKTFGREDIKLFHIKTITTIGSEQVEDYQQYVVEPFFLGSGFRQLTNSKAHEILRKQVNDWFTEFKEQIKEQLDYLDWFNEQKIVDMELEPLLTLLKSYKYNESNGQRLYVNLCNLYLNR